MQKLRPQLISGRDSQENAITNVCVRASTEMVKGETKTYLLFSSQSFFFSQQHSHAHTQQPGQLS